jgi:hypothetical protein
MDETVVDGLPFQDSLIGVVARVANSPTTDTLLMFESLVWSLVADPQWKRLTDVVAVAEGRDASKVKPSGPTATVSQTVAVGLSAGRTVTDNLTIEQFAVPALRNTPPVATRPVVVFTLSCPGVASPVTLRHPDFGDANTYEQFRVSRRNRGGDLQIYHDPMWPTTETFSFKFSYLEPETADEFLEFLKLTVGRKVTLLDHYNRTWDGFIITPEGGVVQEKRTTLTAAFKFQVVPS